MSDFQAILRRELGTIAEVNPAQLDRMQSHWELLQHWNRVLNLTSISSMEAAIRRHYCESIFLATEISDSAESVCDLGSGGGFPGIPIAIMRPGCRVTLIESHRRKAVFLKEASRDLPNVRVWDVRGEKVAERFDLLVSRAVSWRDMAGAIRRLAAEVMLLVGEEDAAKIQRAAAFQQCSVRPLPWGHRRVLLHGVL